MYAQTLAFVLVISAVLAHTIVAITTDFKVPKSFRALVAKSSGSSFSDVATVIEIETPELEKNEALIRVEYAGVNGGCETFRARAAYEFAANKDKTNFRLGAEGVGRVVAVGSEVDNVAVGDAVCFIGSAFSEYSTCKASMCWVIPDATEEYVGLRISALTPFLMLEHSGNIQRGEKVLITAAAGGAGHFAVQCAKLAGCEVIATCGSDEKAQVLKRLGCDHIINYKSQNVKKELNRIAPDGVDVVLEGVGGNMLKDALECLGPEGRLLQIGYISEYPHSDESNENVHTDFDVADLFWKKQTIHRGKQIIYGNPWPKDFSVYPECKNRIIDLFTKKKLESIVDKSGSFVGLESVNDAINHMLSGNTIGKVVVKIR